jgi:hypothetical protein
LLALPSLGPGYHHVDVAAAAARADEPLAPFGDGGPGAIPLGHLGSVGFDPMAARPTPLVAFRQYVAQPPVPSELFPGEQLVDDRDVGGDAAEDVELKFLPVRPRTSWNVPAPCLVIERGASGLSAATVLCAVLGGGTVPFARFGALQIFAVLLFALIFGVASRSPRRNPGFALAIAGERADAGNRRLRITVGLSRRFYTRGAGKGDFTKCNGSSTIGSNLQPQYCSPSSLLTLSTANGTMLLLLNS